MRRLIILPMTKCGKPTPTKRPSEKRQQERRARHQLGQRDDSASPSEIMAYLLSAMSLPVCSSRLRRSAGFGMSVEAKPSTLLDALGEQLADLSLGVGGDDVAVALLDHLDAPLERLGTPTAAHARSISSERTTPPSSDDEGQEHPSVRSLVRRACDAGRATLLTQPSPWACASIDLRLSDAATWRSAAAATSARPRRPRSHG